MSGDLSSQTVTLASRVSPLKAWVLASRPKTLTASLIPIVVAVGLVFVKGFDLNLWIASLCALAALSIQIATNFINDAVDFDKGADTGRRIGPARAVHQGWLSRRAILKAAVFFLVLALAVGVPLVWYGGWTIVLIGLVSIFLAYSYTAGPFPLAYLGLGDLFVLLFFGLIAVGGVYFLLVGDFHFDAVVLGLQVGALSTVLIAINNLRDVEQDRAAHKKTLAVRFGTGFVRIEIALLLLSAFVLQVYWLYRIGWIAAALPLLWLPLGYRIARCVAVQAPSSLYNRFLAESALLHSGFGFLLAVGFYLEATL